MLVLGCDIDSWLDCVTVRSNVSYMIQVGTTCTGVGADDTSLVHFVNVGYEMWVVNDVDGGTVVQ